MECWVVSESQKVGTLNQCLGVAQLLDLDPVIKKINIRLPWRILPPHLWVSPLKSITSTSDTLNKPWPDLIIAGGRGTVAPTAFIRKASAGRTKVIQVLNPKVNPQLFDCVIAPEHDGLKGDNVINILGAIHRVTPEIIEENTKKFKAQMKNLRHPLASVLIGGSNKYYRFTTEEIKKLVIHLNDLHKREHFSFAITVSRRTPLEHLSLIQEGLKHIPHYLWNNEGDNPYFALLGMADVILVTCDSVAMISEACSTGTPVYIYELPSKPQKFSTFHQKLYERSHARPFKGSLQLFQALALNEKKQIKQALLKLLHKAIEL